MVRSRVPGVLLGALLVLAPGVRAQAPSLRPLAPDHWSYRLLEVLDALEGDPAWHPWQAPVLAATVSETLGAGEEERGPGDGAPDLWRRLFREETSLAAVEVGFEASDALPWSDRRGFGGLRGEVRAGDRVTLWAEGEASQERGTSLRTGGVAFRARGLQVVAGRLQPGLGQGLERILLNGSAELQGVWLGSARPVELPGLGFLGRVSGHVFVGPGFPNPPSDSVPGGMKSWFLTTGIRIRPHPAVELAALRTARFAGDSVVSATPGRILETFTVGSPRSDFDDQQGALALRLRFGLLGVRVAPYLTLGYEDPESLWEDPAVVAGVLVPRVVGDDLTSLRYEYTGFGKRGQWCGGCDYVFHQWYRHRAYGPYTRGGRPLGALLGGYGSSHQVELQYWSGSRPLRARALLFRERREEVSGKERIGANLLLHRWPGVRKGTRLEVAFRPAPAWEIEVGGTVSSTEGGGENGVDLRVRLLDVPGLPGG